MNNLTIDIFTSSVEDQELSEYKVLAALKNYAEQLHKNILYPAFGELMEILNMLGSLINQQKYFFHARAQRVTDIDLQNQILIHEPEYDMFEANNLMRLFNFITWAMPKIKEVANEGTAIFDFVESQLSIKEIGTHPFYSSEGYFIVPDKKKSKLHIFQFQLANIFDSDVPFQSLKTSLLDKIDDDNIESSLELIKLDLIKKYPELPDPAVYIVLTELDMPFNETILPVAKRKMMRQLAA